MSRYWYMARERGLGKNRNNQCVCGSGRKFKSCCAGEFPTVEADYRVGENNLSDFMAQQIEWARTWYYDYAEN
jgi:hypothetical protein